MIVISVIIRVQHKVILSNINKIPMKEYNSNVIIVIIRLQDQVVFRLINVVFRKELTKQDQRSIAQTQSDQPVKRNS